jgi:prepilin-type processing-associated H-X9-DG protein
MVYKSLIAKPCINPAAGRNSELHKYHAFVHVIVTEMAKPIICYPVTSGYSVVRDCARCICLVWSLQKVAIRVDCPKCRLLGAGVVTYFILDVDDTYCESDRNRNSNYLFVDTHVTYSL